MVAGLIVVLVVLALASCFGVWRKRTDGVMRMQAVPVEGSRDGSPKETTENVSADTGDETAQSDKLPDENETLPIEGVSERDVRRSAKQAVTVLTREQIGRELGDRATLLQFSSAFCAPCRATKVVLADVASKVDGVEHIEIDAESHLDLVREIGILRTPTTLVLDGAGRVTARASGVPRREQVLAALDVSVR